MSHNDPVAEWRARWDASASAASYFSAQQPAAYIATPLPAPPQKQSFKRIVFASFVGTFIALMLCVGASLGGLLWVGSEIQDAQANPDSLTYRNDTAEDVWFYECYERCEYYSDWWLMEPEDEVDFALDWYGRDRVRWIQVVHDDMSYGCIELDEWVEQTVVASMAIECPSDIRSPTGSHM